MSRPRERSTAGPVSYTWVALSRPVRLVFVCLVALCTLRRAALHTQKVAREIHEERNWSRLVDTWVVLVFNIQDQGPPGTGSNWGSTSRDGR